MTFKELCSEIFLLPAKLFCGILKICFGYSPYKNNANLINAKNGILGAVFNLIMFLIHGFSNFIYRHQAAIASAFWASLMVGGSLVSIFYLWPSTLMKASATSIYGFSLMKLGLSPVVQTGGAVIMSTAATSFVVYVMAAIINLTSKVKKYFGTVDKAVQCDIPFVPGDRNEESNLHMNRSHSNRFFNAPPQDLKVQNTNTIELEPSNMETGVQLEV